MRTPYAPLARVLALVTALVATADCSSSSAEGGTNTNWVCSSDADCVGAPDGPVCSAGLCAASSRGPDASDASDASDAGVGTPDARVDAPTAPEASPGEAGGSILDTIDERCETDLTCTPGDGGLGITFADGACTALPSGCEGAFSVAERQIFDRCRDLAYAQVGGTYCRSIAFDLDASGCVTRFQHDPAVDAVKRVFVQCALAGLASYRWPCLDGRGLLYQSCTN